MAIRLKLKEALADSGVTVYRLGEVSGVPRNTLYNLVNQERERLDLAVLDKVMTALEQLTGERVNVGDLLEREAIAQSDADLAEAGLEDWAAALAEIDADVPPEELAAWNEAFEQASRPHR